MPLTKEVGQVLLEMLEKTVKRAEDMMRGYLLTVSMAANS